MRPDNMTIRIAIICASLSLCWMFSQIKSCAQSDVAQRNYWAGVRAAKEQFQGGAK